MVIFAIEGNIGSGKSTLLKYLKIHYQDKFVYIDEPVEDWKTIVDKETNKNKIQLFYENMKTHAFSFQMMAYISRLTSIKDTIKQNPKKHIIMERSLYTDKNVFAKMLYEDKMIVDTDYQIYMRWFDHFIQELPDIRYLYLQTSPDISLERVRKRDRSGEEGISLEYLTRCHISHEKWLMEEQKINPLKTMFIDGNVDRENLRDYIEMFGYIDKFIETPFDKFVNMMRGLLE